MATLTAFKKWAKTHGTEIHLGFGLVEPSPDLVQKWLGKKTAHTKKVEAALELFGCGPDGSWFAIWTKSAKEKPVVFLDSEGGAFALAESFDDFLRLLALPYDFAAHPALHEPPEDEEMESLNPDYLDFLKEQKLKKPKTGSEIVDPAQDRHADFYGWLMDDEPKEKKSAAKKAKETKEPVAIDPKFAGLSVFDKMIYLLGKRVDSPEAMAFYAELKLKPNRTTNPSDETDGNDSGEKIGIDEISCDCNPKFRPLWPTKKEGRIYVTYITRFMLNEDFKQPMPYGLKWGQDVKDADPKVTAENRGNKKHPSFEMEISPEASLLTTFEDGKLSRVILILNEERDIITTSAEYEAEKPLVYVEDAFFAVWCALNNKLDPKKFTDDVIKPYRQGMKTPLQFINETCGRLLWEKDLAEKDRKDLMNYYSAFEPYQDPNSFREAVKKTFGKKNHFRNDDEKQTQDTWENYEKLAKEISKTLKS